MKDNKNVRQLFKYVTLIIVLMLVMQFYEIPFTKAIPIVAIFGTIFLFYDYYAPTYIVNINDVDDVNK